MLARAEQARDVLPEGLERLGYAVDVLPVYRTVTATPDPDDLARVRAGDVDAITFTSSSTVTNFCDLVGPLPDPAPAVVSIGPVTSDHGARRGAWSSTAEADPHTIDGLVAALLATLVPPVVEPDLDRTSIGSLECDSDVPRAAPPPAPPHRRPSAASWPRPASTSTTSSRRCS